MTEPRRVRVTADADATAGAAHRMPRARGGGTIGPETDRRVRARQRAAARLAVGVWVAVAVPVGVPLALFTQWPRLSAARIAGVPTGTLVLIAVVPGLLFVIGRCYLGLIERVEAADHPPR